MTIGQFITASAFPDGVRPSTSSVTAVTTRTPSVRRTIDRLSTYDESNEGIINIVFFTYLIYCIFNIIYIIYRCSK